MVSPHEFLITGNKRQGQGSYTIQVGSEVPGPAASFLVELFTSPRYAFTQGSDQAPDLPYLQELQLRNFDMSTLRLSIFQNGHGAPRKPRVLAQRPGVLAARWGWLPYDKAGDVTASFGAPVCRADLSLTLSLLSRPPLFLPKTGQELMSQVPRYFFNGGIERMKALNWDLRTLDFSIRHLGWLYRPDFAGQKENF